MRILHITRDFPPRTKGGISTAVGGMARAQVRAGHTSAAISFDAYRPRARARAAEAARSDRVGSISVLRVSAPSQLGDAHAFADAYRPEIVHVHHAMLWPLAAELRARHAAPAVITVHVAQAAQDRLRGLAEPTASARAESEALAGADLVHAPSRAAAAELLPPASRALIAPLGVFDDGGDRSPISSARPDGPVVYAGRFADINGTEDLIAAIRRLVPMAPRCSFVIAGGCPDSPRADARWRRRLERELPAAARERVELSGWLGPERLSRLYARAAALLVPSWFETFGLVTLEGMLHGAPIAATRGGALAEILDHGETALLSAPGDADTLAEHAAFLLRHPERGRELGERAAHRARERYLWDDVIGEILAAYSALRA